MVIDCLDLQAVAAPCQRIPLCAEVDWEGIKRRVEGDVESGRITRREAVKIYEGIKKRRKRLKRRERER